MQVQAQVHIKEDKITRDQTLTKQKEGLQAPLTKQTTVRHIEQDLENDKIPKHINKPMVTEIKITIYPDPLMKPPPRLPDVKTQAPLTKQTTVRHIEQDLENDKIPKHINKPMVTEIKITIYPDPLMKPPPRLPDVKTQDDRKINLDLDLEINKDFEENSLYQEGIKSEIYQDQIDPN